MLVLMMRIQKREEIGCDDCLGGFHLKCLKLPLKTVPERDWICGFSKAKKLGKKVKLPIPKGKKLVRIAKEKLLFNDLWAAHIKRKEEEEDEDDENSARSSR
ncbi:hypothetical protein LguiA_002913 [Lonicera macranthoides]